MVSSEKGVYQRTNRENIRFKWAINRDSTNGLMFQLGYSYLNNIPFYICNTDFCNSNIQNALEEAKNSSLAVRDNGADEEKCLLTLIYVVVSLLLTSWTSETFWLTCQFCFIFWLNLNRWNWRTTRQPTPPEIQTLLYDSGFCYIFRIDSSHRNCEMLSWFWELSQTS